MNELDNLIEKYRRDMLEFSSRSRYEDERQEENEAEKLSEDIAEDIEENMQSPENENRTSEVNTIPQDGGDMGTSPENKTGSLKVMVFAGNEAFPLPSARVQVYDSRETELYTVFTDGNGIAENIFLPAPDRENTDAPGEPMGFALYKVKVSHPDYETAVFRDVQVYDGIESIQEAYLLPLMMAETGERVYA